MRYYKIDINTNENFKPPYFTGSMFRGAMGYALKRVVCINPTYKCDGCFAQSSCLFYHFYEAQNILHHYRFDIELDSNRFDFGLYLFGSACDDLPYILSALDMLLTKQGLTKNNYTFKEASIFVNSMEVYRDGEFNSIDIATKTLKLDSFSPDIKIKLQTPLRMKKKNKLLKESIEIEDILRSIYQREQEIFYNKKVFKLEYKPSYTTTATALNYKSIIRQSNKQQTKMNMDGLLGEIVILGIDKDSYRLLKLGEIIGVGKQTVMGLGRIEIEDL